MATPTILNPDIGKNISFAYEVMVQKLEAQDRAHDALETKMGVLLGFTGAIGGGGAALLFTNHLLGCNLLTLSLVGIYAALALLIIASLPATYYSPPGYEDIYSAKALAVPVDVVKNQAVANMIEGYKENEIIQNGKASLYKAALYIFAASTALIFLSLIIQQNDAGRPTSRIPTHRSSRTHWQR
jgi:hypothetical protein